MPSDKLKKQYLQYKAELQQAIDRQDQELINMLLLKEKAYIFSLAAVMGDLAYIQQLERIAEQSAHNSGEIEQLYISNQFKALKYAAWHGQSIVVHYLLERLKQFSSESKIDVADMGYQQLDRVIEALSTKKQTKVTVKSMLQELKMLLLDYHIQRAADKNNYYGFFNLGAYFGGYSKQQKIAAVLCLQKLLTGDASCVIDNDSHILSVLRQGTLGGRLREIARTSFAAIDPFGDHTVRGLIAFLNKQAILSDCSMII